MSDIENQPRSVSQTEQWEKCGHRYWLQRVERVTPRPAAWSMHGTAFHSAAEAVERSCGTMTEEEAVQHFSDLYGQLVNKALDQEPDLNRWLAANIPGGDDIERRYVLGQEHVKQYVAWSRENAPDIWITPAGEQALELYFMVEIGGIQVRGYIDQMIAEPGNTLRVRDLKTGSTKSKFQLWTYKVAVEKQWGIPVNRGDWWLGKSGGLSRAVKLGEITEAEVGARYAAMDAGVKAGRFEANPGFDCRFCDMNHACSFSTART